MFFYQVNQIKNLTEHVSQFFLQPTTDAYLAHAPGQYIEVVHHDHRISPLSIASAPRQDKLFEFHLYHAPENKKAENLLHIAQQKGIWHLRGPFGNCTPKQLHPEKPIIFLAQGTGFAPIKAMLEACIPTFSLPIHFFWVVPTQSEFYLLENIAIWQQENPHFVFTPLVTSAFSTAFHTIQKMYPDFSAKQVYACGPKAFLQIANQEFIQQGLSANSFFADR